MLKPIDAFYGFWNSGSAMLLDRALAPSFADHTLPPGRPQGPRGPAAAGKAFLAAVPDLVVTVVQRLVVGDRVVSHMHFTGRFIGSFMGHAGKGQPIDFIATDILRVRGGRIRQLASRGQPDIPAADRRRTAVLTLVPRTRGRVMASFVH